MARRIPSSGRDKSRLRKHDLLPHTYAPPTTSTVPAFTTPTSNTSSVLPSLHTQEFVMISNPGYIGVRALAFILPVAFSTSRR